LRGKGKKEKKVAGKKKNRKGKGSTGEAASPNAEIVGGTWEVEWWSLNHGTVILGRYYEGTPRKRKRDKRKKAENKPDLEKL